MNDDDDEADPWHAQVPNVHRWLNGQRDRPFDRDATNQCGGSPFWFAPFYVMRGLLGWRDIGSGVAHVLTEAGEPNGPAAMLTTAWDEATLGTLGWWAWTNADYFQYEPSPIFPEHGYPERYREIARRNGFAGGCDPMHLTGHLWPYSPLAPSAATAAPAIERIIAATDGKGALIIGHTSGLLTALTALSPRVPDARPAWVVHVTARDHGYLGGYRRCARCRRWFTGRYAPHAWGHTRDE
jgi:hypothetical protein